LNEAFFFPRGLIINLKDLQFHSNLGQVLLIDDGEDKNPSMLHGVSQAADEKDFVIWLIVTAGAVLMFLEKQTFFFF